MLPESGHLGFCPGSVVVGFFFSAERLPPTMAITASEWPRSPKLPSVYKEMSYYVVVALVLSALCSLVLVISLWRSSEYVVLKVLLTALTFIPFLGIVFYGFYWCISQIAPQEKLLQNRGARGDYTHTWISTSPLLRKILKEKEGERNEVSDEKQGD